MSKRSSIKRHRKPPFERAKDHCRKFTAFLFSNVGIILLVTLYMIAGAFMFRAIEVRNKTDKSLKEILAKERQNVATILWNLTVENKTFLDIKLFRKSTEKEILNYQQNIIKIHALEPDMVDLWSFPGAFLYSLTVITTIGYGNISPRTNMGKIFTIIYAIIGMPLFLLYLSNIGDILAKIFKWIYAKICLCRVCPGVARRRAIRQRRRTEGIITLEKDINVFLEDGYYRNQSRVNEKYFPNRLYSVDEFEEMEESSLNEDIDAEISGDPQTITVPITVCVAIMIGYILLGATLFGEWEKWSLLNGSYFCFISLSSIGFGDIVPGDKVIKSKVDDLELSFILCAVYLLLGMALIAMCFNLMQEQVIHKMRSFKRMIRICFRCDR